MSEEYWNHNTEYHRWILQQIRSQDRVLDVGCGDGLLVQRLSLRCPQVIGIEPHKPSAERAEKCLTNLPNASILPISFQAYRAPAGSYDVVIFAASFNHMDFASSIQKAGICWPRAAKYQ